MGPSIRSYQKLSNYVTQNDLQTLFDAVSDPGFHEVGTNAKGSELGLK